MFMVSFCELNVYYQRLLEFKKLEMSLKSLRQKFKLELHCLSPIKKNNVPLISVSGNICGFCNIICLNTQTGFDSVVLKICLKK